MDAHSHGLNNHMHSFSWSGTTGAMSKNSTGDFQQAIRNVAITAYSPRPAENDSDYVYTAGNFSLLSSKFSQNFWKPDHEGNAYTEDCKCLHLDVSHTHTYSGSGTTGKSSGDTATTTSTGKFSGTKGTTENTGGNNGAATSFSILPPYVVKYCWERTA